jgi:hypothetical protein
MGWGMWFSETHLHSSHSWGSATIASPDSYAPLKSPEKEGNVMETLFMKNIVGKNHRAYVIDDESCFFQDLSLTACFE